METKKIPSSIFGLIGARLDYSFSRAYFSQKFEELKLKDHEYRNFELGSEEDLVRFRESVLYNPSQRTTLGKSEILRGLNVTIPYKESMLKVVDRVSEEAEIIGAINTVVIEDNIWTGHNTDAYGFAKSLEPFLPIDGNALILGTGGASKAVAYTLESLQIPFLKVSRSPGDDEHTIDYKVLNKDVLSQVKLIINTTPLGTHPDIHQCPLIPYEHLGKQHILYDLVYNPSQTLFMKKGLQQGAKAVNGYQMLVHQAERAWELWNR
ncbi:shikimate dehydrogenase family protein [Nonlabens marinus]|uniref:Shikimate 5-dehydrogenase I alpha n=1 Tax=Nonlabens marinus S1-08 TaxID=1454201 RepID=W8VSH6_9FLAO|nr:shikimate dehydrogenase [Nonlabens marinus]BAO56205.1 shikimate 5-dehydrogenase I alpha [Nonlabens marinus S1-08]